MDARPALIVAAALLTLCSPANAILNGSPAGGPEVQVLGTQIGTPDQSGGTGTANLLLMSQNFSAPDWASSSFVQSGASTYGYPAIVLTSGQSDPSSGATAYSVTENSEIKNSYPLEQSQTKASSSKVYTFSIYAKQALRTRVYLQLSDGFFKSTGYAGTVCDLARGQIGVAASASGSFSSASSTITSEGNGYWRCALTASSSTRPTITGTIEPDAGSGTAAVNTYYAGTTSTPALYVAWAQLEQASRASVYAYTTSRGQVLATLTNGGYVGGSTWWEAPVANAWAGVDAGSGNSPTWTRYRVAPRPSSTVSYDLSQSLAYGLLMAGATAKVSNDPTFGSEVTTVDTVPAAPYLSQLNLNERVLTPISSRAINLTAAGGAYGNMAQLQFFARESTIGTAAAAPVTPTISPWGGRILSGSTTVTLASLTSDASIYYTTDGSMPSSRHGTLYSGPFTLTFSSATTLKAVAYRSTLSTTLSAVSTAIFNPWAFKPNDVWYDSNGFLVQAHSGGITYVNGVYYWYGQSTNEPYIPRYSSGIWMYSSPDLYTWTPVGADGHVLLLPPETYLVGDSLPLANFERPHIIYNALTSKFVMWAHVTDNAYNIIYGRAAVATAPAITGPWTIQTLSLAPDGHNFGDCNLFVDSDGVTAYVVWVDYTTDNFYISQLAPDYLSTTGINNITVANNTLFSNAQEAPVLFKSGSTYFWIVNDQEGFNSGSASNAKQYAVNTGASPTANSWVNSGSIGVGTPNDPYNGQISFALQIPGSPTKFILGMDWWNNPAWQTSNQSWSPMTVSGNTLTVTQPTTWDIVGTFGR